MYELGSSLLFKLHIYQGIELKLTKQTHFDEEFSFKNANEDIGTKLEFCKEEVLRDFLLFNFLKAVMGMFDRSSKLFKVYIYGFVTLYHARSCET